jgi:single-strand DNA-binding protein
MLNRITLMGRLTKDPELRRAGETPVASFSVAVDRDIADKSTGQRETDFIDCVAWKGTGEFISRNFKKGAQICVDGRLQIRKWRDKDNNPRSSAEVVVANAYFAGARGDSGAGGGLYTAPAPAGGAYPETEALLQSYGVKPKEFAMIDDEDAQLPF